MAPFLACRLFSLNQTGLIVDGGTMDKAKRSSIAHAGYWNRAFRGNPSNRGLHEPH
jgi:hypothetical protein